VLCGRAGADLVRRAAGRAAGRGAGGGWRCRRSILRNKSLLIDTSPLLKTIDGPFSLFVKKTSLFL
jgi:hypothetical protein